MNLLFFKYRTSWGIDMLLIIFSVAGWEHQKWRRSEEIKASIEKVVGFGQALSPVPNMV